MPEPQSDTSELALKVKRLVEERGWNQEDLVRGSRLNRHTVRQIMSPGDQPLRKLRNATINALAKALGLSVSELRTQPLEKLLPRMVEGDVHEDVLRQRYDRAEQPELRAWIERNPDRARRLSDEDMEELFAMQGPEGPLVFGVDAIVGRMERRAQLLRKVAAIAGTEYVGLLEQLVALLYEKVQPT
jgi:transcriptional regulator with XRE-family HTH domain